MIMTLLLVLAAALAGLAALVSTRPDTFTVTRSRVFSAAPATVFAEVNNLRRWEAWSPWARLDPACKNSFTGPEEGPGAQMEWDGNHKVGSGKMTIETVRQNESIRMRLQFFKPFKAVNTTEFTFAPEGTQTRMVWTMSGANTMMGKLMSLFINCDDMVGSQFEQGMENLQKILAAR